MAETYSRQISIYVDSGNAQAAYDKLLVKQKSLTTEVNKYTAAGKAIPEKLTKQLDAVTASMDRQAQKLKGTLSPSYKDLAGTVSNLTRELNRMSEQDAGFAEKKKQLIEAKAALQSYGSALGTIKKGWADMLQQAKGVAFGVLVGNTLQSGLQAVSGYFSGIVSGAAKVSDELSDVKRTTGLTKEGVRQLNSELSKIDTRTGSSELRQLAAEAGKLGKSGVEEIRKFVKEANQIKVALGEDLGDGAIIQIAKASKLFEESALNFASGVNEIGQSSEATEAFTVDFAFRMSGIARTVKLTAGEVMGFSAALELNGQQVEASATALQNFFIEFTKNSNKFGKAVGMATGEMGKLINSKGTNAAFLEFLKRLKEGSKSSDELLQKLEKLGIDGARGASAFLALANSTEMIAKQQQIANAAIAEGSSITNEYASRNDNLAGKIEKLSKAWNQLTASSSVQDWLSNAVDVITAMTTTLKENLPALTSGFKDLGNSISETWGELNFLYNATTGANEKTSLFGATISGLGKAISASFTPFKVLGAYNEWVSGGLAKAALYARTFGETLSNWDWSNWNARLEENKRRFEGIGEAAANAAKQVRTLMVGGEEIDNPRSGKASGSPVVGDGAGLDEEAMKKAAKAQEDRAKSLAELTEEVIRFKKELFDETKTGDDAIIAKVERRFDALKKKLKEFPEMAAALRVIEQAEREAIVRALQIEPIAARGTTDPTMQLAGKVDLPDQLTEEEKARKRTEEFKNSVNEVGGQIQQWGGMMVQTISGINDIMNRMEDEQLRKLALRYEKRSQMLKDNLEKGLITQKTYDQLSESNARAKERKEKEIRKKQWGRQQAMQMMTAIINTAAGVTQALGSMPPPGSYVMAAMTGAMGAAEIGIIASQKPPEFGDGGDIEGNSHAQGGVPIIAEGGEYMINKRSTAKYRPLLEMINNNPDTPLLNVNRAMDNMSFANGGPVQKKYGNTVHADALAFIPDRANGGSNSRIEQLLERQNQLLAAAQNKQVVLSHSRMEQENRTVSFVYERNL